ncbi:YhjD/YihY/BrkB family envelope integrity protein [Syntrophus gentianae]
MLCSEFRKSSNYIIHHYCCLVDKICKFLTSISSYLVMPVRHVIFRHALIGGLTAAVLWEISRRVLVWYYKAVSMVNVIYGSITTTVIALLCIEVVAVILLLGAQVIAELENTPPPRNLTRIKNLLTIIY